MGIFSCLAAAVLLSFAARGRCADAAVSFDNADPGQSIEKVLGELRANKPGAGPQNPGFGHKPEPRPGDGPKPGPRPGDRHDGRHDRPDPRDHRHDWDHHHFEGYEADCRTWEFTSQTPNTRTEEFLVEEKGLGKYDSRKVTVTLGSRVLQSWEKEELGICLSSPDAVDLDTSAMAYEYAVASKDTSGFFSGRSTELTLTPGNKKPAQPDSKELSVASVTPLPGAGGVSVVFNDARADYFRGEKMNISVDGMRLPVIDPNAPVSDVLDQFVSFQAQGSYDVAPSYELKAAFKAKPGKYVLTIKFSRQGPLSAATEASTVESFDLP